MQYLAASNLGLANALSYHASRKVYGLWLMLLFICLYVPPVLKQNPEINC